MSLLYRDAHNNYQKLIIIHQIVFLRDQHPVEIVLWYIMGVCSYLSCFNKWTPAFNTVIFLNIGVEVDPDKCIV